MYMDSQHWDMDNRMPYESPINHKMSSAPSSGGQNKTSLPPLHQAIPEFHSHSPLERRSSSVPRSLSDRGSPSYNHQRVSPNRGGEAAEVYDAQQYKFPGNARASTTNGYPNSPTSYSTDARPSPYLPPVSSLTSSRGSSLDAEPERNPHSYTSYSAGYEQPHRYHPSHSYRSSSPPLSTYAQGSHYPPPRPAGPPSSSSSSSVGAQDLTMDHFDTDRPGSKRRRGNLPKQVTDLLRAWLSEHLHHPYPTEDEKQMLMAQTGLTIHQISNWFINARRRRIPAITSSDLSKPRRPS